MIFLSHLLIGNIIYKEIVNREGIKLDKTAFLYGNIKPDIYNNDINSQHTFNESIDKLKNYSEKIKYNEENIKKISQKLGVISHFISDYFCLYHIGQYAKKNIVSHIIYEIRLHFRFLYMIKNNKINFIEYSGDTESLRNIIYTMQNSHNLHEQNIDRDIIYALSTSLGALTPIISEIELNVHNKINLTENVEGVL